MIKTIKRILTCAALVALMSACGIYGSYRPADSVPENLYGDAVPTGDTTNFGNLEWKEVFRDTCLQALIERGLANNTDYLSAQYRVQEAEATLKAARLSFLPSFALSPQGSVSGAEGTQATWDWQVPVTASWEIDIFGRMRNAKEQAKALYAQSEDYRQAVRSQLIASIANTYYTLLMLDAQLEISRQTAQAWEETVNASEALMNAGQYDLAGVAQMQATYYSVQTSVLDLEEQINQTENSMALLLAETPRHYERGRLDRQQMPEELSAGVPIQMLSNRPDVRSAEHALEAAFYATNQARSAFYPSIVLSGSAGWSDQLGAAISNPVQFIASALGALTQPLFSRGQNKAQLEIAKAQQEEAKLSFQQTLLSAGVEVNDALTAWQASRDRRKLYEKQIDALKTAVGSTSLLMEYGTHTYLEVLTARQSLLSAELNQIANRFAEIQGVVNLFQALGGGR